jgi:hypothetical protein
VMREALRLQMMEFGRTPRQVRRSPHIDAGRLYKADSARVPYWPHSIDADWYQCCIPHQDPCCPGTGFQGVVEHLHAEERCCLSVAALHQEAPQAAG